jgi:hypothetical protein
MRHVLTSFPYQYGGREGPGCKSCLKGSAAFPVDGRRGARLGRFPSPRPIARLLRLSAASRWRQATPGSPEQATLEAWAEASFSESTIRAIGIAAPIPTAGAGGRRSVEWSSGGSRAATSAFGTKEAARPNGSGRRTRRRNAGSPDPWSFLVGAHVKLVFRMVRRRSRPGAESAYEPLCQRERRSVRPGRLLPHACSGCRRHAYGGCCLRGGVLLDRLWSRDRPLSDRRPTCGAGRLEVKTSTDNPVALSDEIGFTVIVP